MKLKRLVAGVLSTAMMLSIGSTLAFADETDPSVIDSVTFASQLNMSADAVTAPSATFTYKLTAGDPVSDTDIKEGVLPSDTEEDATFTTDMVLAPNTATEDMFFSENVTFYFAVADYTTAGIYHYVITADDKMDSESGYILDADDERHVYVYVYWGEDADNDDNPDLYIGSIIMTTDALDATGLADLSDEKTDNSTYKSKSFVNSYGVDGSEGEDPDAPIVPGNPGDEASEDFIVTNIISGNMADYTEVFTFTFSDGSGIADGTIFKVTTADNETAYVKYTEAADENSAATFTEVTYAEDSETFTDSDAFTFKLGDSATLSILSVVNGMTFEATDVATANNDDYTITSKTVDDTEYAESSTVSYTVNSSDEDEEGLDFKATYDYNIPSTGVVLDLAPYALMIVLAGAFITFRMVKSARKDEE